ncbi:hypothetical protein [Pseudomonas sp. PARCl1]|uniref:hypothetical protein n=1 Tax=Pseudomonas sp. PARCl1 TaxID=2853444 RepID=UPI00248D54D3|nr:hypothetical protein [Pseudomonas sp. PARCl1]
MKSSEWHSEYSRLVRDMMGKAEAADRYAKTADHLRSAHDEKFANLQEELKVAMHNVEEHWRKLFSGQVT